MNGCCFNSDTQALYGQFVLDVNAAVKFLREEKGAETVVLFGNSGGGSLSAMFQVQAELPP